jgi:anti-sigma factor RsiW
MHLKKETLYFYLKNDMPPAEKNAVEVHLEACAGCAASMDAILKLRAALSPGLEQPPALDLSMAVKPRSHAPSMSRPAFAAGLAAVIVVSGLFVGRLFIPEDSQKKVSNFVYKTYSTVYDFNYYSRNYLEGTDIYNVR